MTPDTLRPHCQNRDACAAKTPSTHCRRCAAAALMANPAIRARHQKGIDAKFADPAKREAHNAVATANIRRFLDRPGSRDYLRARADEIRPLSRTPEAVERRVSRIRESAERRTQTLLPWCPPEWLDEYRRLTRVKHLKPAEARAIIEAEIEHRSPVAEGRRIVARIQAEMARKAARERREAY